MLINSLYIILRYFRKGDNLLVNVSMWLVCLCVKWGVRRTSIILTDITFHVHTNTYLYQYFFQKRIHTILHAFYVSLDVYLCGCECGISSVLSVSCALAVFHFFIQWKMLFYHILNIKYLWLEVVYFRRYGTELYLQSDFYLENNLLILTAKPQTPNCTTLGGCACACVPS